MGLILYVVICLAVTVVTYAYDEVKTSQRQTREAIDIYKKVSTERDQLRGELLSIAGMTWVAEDGSRRVWVSMTRPGTTFVQNDERVQ